MLAFVASTKYQSKFLKLCFSFILLFTFIQLKTKQNLCCICTREHHEHYRCTRKKIFYAFAHVFVFFCFCKIMFDRLSLLFYYSSLFLSPTSLVNSQTMSNQKTQWSSNAFTNWLIQHAGSGKSSSRWKRARNMALKVCNSSMMNSFDYLSLQHTCQHLFLSFN